MTNLQKTIRALETKFKQDGDRIEITTKATNLNLVIDKMLWNNKVEYKMMVQGTTKWETGYNIKRLAQDIIKLNQGEE